MLGPIRFRILEEITPYTGRELRPHWVLQKTGIYGSAIAAFIGPCKVETSDLVDWEDRLRNDTIHAQSMLHFVAEFFDTSLESGILYQRLFIVWIEHHLRVQGAPITREGDDLWIGHGPERGKLSVSIATKTPVSVLIHWGINIDPTGAPVKAAGLASLGIEPGRVLPFAKNLLTDYIQETEEIRIAQCKVKPAT